MKQRLALLLCLALLAACAVPARVFIKALDYEPIYSPDAINATALIETSATLTPEMQANWQSHHLSADTTAKYLQAYQLAMRKDLSTSGLFARIATGPDTPHDYVVHAHFSGSGVTLTVTATSSHRQIYSHTREFSSDTSHNQMPEIMTTLKAGLIADLARGNRASVEEEAQQELASLENAPLSELLAATDKSSSLARARNRALIAAKIRQLPEILRNWNASEITTLIVKIEQTILDLDHECELARDKIQQPSSLPAPTQRPGRGTGSTPGSFEETDSLGALALCYRERIELLKPILTSLKDELANRNR